MQPGNQFLLWDTDLRARHETMNRNDCIGALRMNCAWIGATGVAISWLASDGLATVSGGVIELQRR
jgi:hypothetical protein